MQEIKSVQEEDGWRDRGGGDSKMSVPRKYKIWW